MRTEILPLMLRDWMDVSNYILLVVICLVFFRLPPKSRKRPENILTFLYGLVLLMMDFIGFSFRLFQDLNGSINAFLGNTEKPYYNAWIYNLIMKMILPVIAIVLIRIFLPPRQKAVVLKILLGFVLFAIAFQVLQIEPIYLNQGVLFAVGALCILATCFIYLHSLMVREEYLDINILLLASFWQVTFIMFYVSLNYFSDVSLTYLAENQRAFLISIFTISRITGLVHALVFILCLAAPMLKIKLENQPFYA